jgi:peptidoglycan/xylan/chitin deacetylase (PgdA/CDA1 family)
MFARRALPPVIFAYHGIEIAPRGAPNGDMCVPPAALDRHLRLLRQWDYRFVPFGELAHDVLDGRGRGCAALTFDDGFAGCATFLPPILRRYDASATIFVVSGWLGRRHPDALWARIVDAPALRLLAAAGVEIGSHAATHPHLDRLEYADAYAELRDSKETLEAVLDRPVSVVAYPFGAANAATRTACRAAGYLAACRFRGAGTWTDPFDLPRQPVGRGTSPVALWLKSRDQYERLRQMPGARQVRHFLGTTTRA